MPELPEVETMRRGIVAIEQTTITTCEALPCKLQPIAIKPPIKALRQRLTGTTIRRVDRLGKRILLRLDSEDVLVLEPRMTGLVLLAEPPNREHLRLRLTLDRPPHQLLYWDRRGLGSVRLLTLAELERVLGPAQLGPDALEISLPELRQRLKHSRRAIKIALLDQRAIAGIGNIYASEMLHVARLHPEKPCHTLSGQAWRRLHAAMRDVLSTAIRYEGSTLADGTYRNALNRRGDYQNHHRVYARAGVRCLSCGRGTIRRMVLAQRATFYCTCCQRKPRGGWGRV